MPPIRGKKAQKSIDQEGRLLLAIKAIKNGQIPSITAAARLSKSRGLRCKTG
jgi:predicted HTH domain antitoxin